LTSTITGRREAQSKGEPMNLRKRRCFESPFIEIVSAHKNEENGVSLDVLILLLPFILLVRWLAGIYSAQSYLQWWGLQ
jgi:hypothetical protein